MSWIAEIPLMMMRLLIQHARWSSVGVERQQDKSLGLHFVVIPMDTPAYLRLLEHCGVRGRPARRTSLLANGMLPTSIGQCLE